MYELLDAMILELQNVRYEDFRSETQIARRQKTSKPSRPTARHFPDFVPSTSMKNGLPSDFFLMVLGSCHDEF